MLAFCGTLYVGAGLVLGPASARLWSYIQWLLLYSGRESTTAYSLTEREGIVAVILDFKWPAFSFFVQSHKNRGAIDFDIGSHQTNLLSTLGGGQAEVYCTNVF